jgi:signal transduction histidine kinase
MVELNGKRTGTVSSPLGEAQSQEAIVQLTASVAHDFNNQMQAVSGFIELAMLRTDDAQMLGHLHHAHDAAMKGLKLSIQLAALSRMAGEA